MAKDKAKKDAIESERLRKQREDEAQVAFLSLFCHSSVIFSRKFLTRLSFVLSPFSHFFSLFFSLFPARLRSLSAPRQVKLPPGKPAAMTVDDTHNLYMYDGSCVKIPWDTAPKALVSTIGDLLKALNYHFDCVNKHKQSAPLFAISEPILSSDGVWFLVLYRPFPPTDFL